MSDSLVYLPSGRGVSVRDHCRDCAQCEFSGEIVMVYDPASGDVYILCQRCYRRRLEESPFVGHGQPASRSR